MEHSWHLFVVQLKLAKLKIDRNTFINQLRDKNIGTSVHFIPLHLHPFYREHFGFTPDSFPNATEAYSRVFSLPIYPRMSEADVWDVIHAVRDIVERNRAGRVA